MKIAFIGAGAMGEAMISALLKQDGFARDAVFACDIDPVRLARIGEEHKVTCGPDVREAVKGREVVVLSIKPQSFASVANDLRGQLEPGQVVLSIMAGTTIETVRGALKHEAIVRAMPNTPAQFGQGITVWTATGTVSQAQRAMVQTILNAMGKEIYVPDEKFIDMATAVSGSGPAYVFLLMEALIDGAVHIGLPRDMATELVLQTFLGSAHMAIQSQKHLAALKNSVTSPGGTTAEGLLRMEEGGVRTALIEGIIAAYEKSRLLGREKSS